MVKKLINVYKKHNYVYMKIKSHVYGNCSTKYFAYIHLKVYGIIGKYYKCLHINKKSCTNMFT